MKNFNFGDREFGFLSPYIIAEIGVNHEGDIDRAKRMIQAAADGGAHAAKFQSYKADLLATKDYSPSYWDRSQESADSQHALFQRWDNFDESDYLDLASTCKDCGVDFLSTPFHLEAVDMIAELSPIIKIASADITNVPLLRKIGSVNKPVIMSLGASTLDEVEVALKELNAFDVDNISLLHCVLNYPTSPENAQIGLISELIQYFGNQYSIGYSDHVVPDDNGNMPVLDLAVVLGARIIEKHFTDDKFAVGNDHYHAMNLDDLKRFTQRLKKLRELYGDKKRDLSGQDMAIQNARRRIVAAKDLHAEDVIIPNDLIALRSNRGIEISHWDRVIDRRLARSIAKGTPLEWDDIR